MNIRKEREKEFFVQHMPTFVKLGLADPHFIIKTAFFQKGKFGRQVQFFDSEIGKGEDVYVEFYDNVTDDKGKVTDVTPFNADRQLFKYKYNPFYKEELETKEGVSSKGEPYVLYTVPTSEMLAVMKDGSEITYAAYEKMKESTALETPKEQKSLFPDFEKDLEKTPQVEVPSFKVSEVVPTVQTINADPLDVAFSDITLRDVAALILLTPISKKAELNELIIKAKSEL
jgi:hypothetical protein